MWKSSLNASFEGPQPLQRVVYERSRSHGAIGRRHLQSAIEFAALDDVSDEVAAFRLERSQILRHPEGEIEEPMIHAADLPRKAQRTAPRFSARKSRHAVRHLVESVRGLSQSGRRFALRASVQQLPCDRLPADRFEAGAMVRR
jgi:hypothetical protein